MADVNRGNRPLSPHLTIYRRHLTMMTSIAHRITGCGLGVGGILLVWWFLAAARGPDYFAMVDGLVTSWLGGFVLVCCLVALWYHFFNGIRHLAWDAGFGFSIEEAHRSGIAVLVATAVMTVITLIIAWT